MKDEREQRHELDYLAKDFNSFRQLMLDQISLRAPAWNEEHPADMAQAVVDVLAYVADYLSYYQDAVATESYLGTARLRISVRRHARLLDYPLDDGCNARVWVQIPAWGTSNRGIYVPQGTQLLTRVSDEQQTLCLRSDDAAVGDLITRGALVFETMHDAWLYPELNTISFFVPGSEAPMLDAGERIAYLEDAYVETGAAADAAGQGQLPAVGRGRRLDALREGDVLIFETVRDAETGVPLKEGADPLHRHVLRIKTCQRTVGWNDDGTERPVLAVTWDAADAPQLPFVLKRRDATGTYTDITVAHGNIILADHGRTVRDEVLPPVPEIGRYNPPLLRRGITFHASYPIHTVRTLSARATVEQDPRAIVPSIRLIELGTDVAEPQRLRVDATLRKQADERRHAYALAAEQGQEEGPEPASLAYRIRHVDENGKPASMLLVDAKDEPEAFRKLLEQRQEEVELPDLIASRSDIRSAVLEFVPISASTDASDLIGFRTDGRVVVKDWQGRGELMGTGQRTREFVVEVEDDGRAFLRFGFGDVGWEPSAVGAPFRATYRVGIGAAGNVGPNAIRHIVTGRPELQLMFESNRDLRVRNFLPATGGRDPAPIATARLEAPAAVQVQERCVTAEDYAARAMAYADVEQAVARMHQVGSWQAIFIYVRRVGGLAVDKAFRAELAGYFERYRMIGHQVEVLGPVLVPLWIEIHVYLQAGHHATKVAGPLAAALGWESPGEAPHAFFDPSDFKFGETFYRSRLVARAMRVDGVARVEVQAFCRQSDRVALEAARQPDTGVNKLPEEEEIKRVAAEAARLLREEINLREVELAHLDSLEVDWLEQPGASGVSVLSAAVTPGAGTPAAAPWGGSGAPGDLLVPAAARAPVVTAPASVAPPAPVEAPPPAPALAEAKSRILLTSTRKQSAEVDVDTGLLDPGQVTLVRGAFKIHLWGLL